MNDIFLGEPPANIKAWIIAHYSGGGGTDHPETRFTLEGGTVETYNITGKLNSQWLSENGYINDGMWEKIITQVDIGNTVTSLGDEVFSSCTLASVTIPNSVTNLGDCVFSSCPKLTNATLGNGITSIGAYMFNACYNLTIVNIPNNVTSIEDYAFNGCSRLTNITIPNAVTSIGTQAFQECSHLTSIIIPDSVNSIGDAAFNYCQDITSVTIVANGGNAASVKQMMIDAGVSESITWNMPS